jgi:hypothetical protein
MVPNPITDEIREIRHRLAAQFDNDVSRIGAETRRRQAASGRRVIRLPSRTPADRKLLSQEASKHSLWKGSSMQQLNH